jgi:signal transduction histidine kinase
MDTLEDRTVRPQGDALELERIARALRAIAKEISYGGLATALLQTALEYCGAVRGAVLLSEGGELLARADASFPREGARVLVSQPAVDEFQLPEDLSERVLARRETVIRDDGRNISGLVSPEDRQADPITTILCTPLIHQEQTIGLLYLESEREQETFTPECVSVISMLTSQAAVSFESVQLFEALRETNMWMVRGQQIGRMGSYRWNTRTLLSRASRECYRIFGISLETNPVPFELFRARVHPDDRPGLEKSLAGALSTRSPFSHEYRIVHEDGKTLHVIAVGQFDLSPAGDVELEGIIADVTEQKIAEQAVADARVALARATRLASLGEFAGSIVHEINQPLTAIIASAEACLRWLTRRPADVAEARNSAMRAIEQSRRVTNVVSGLRSLVRDEQLRFADVNVNETIEEALVLSKRELDRGGVAVETDFDAAIGNIEADRVQIQQVVVNLVRNAIDAMTVVNGRARVLRATSRVAQDHVSVSIADTGMGIDSDRTEDLFSALYTTKGEGLGLGLSICRKIVSVHGGRIWAEKNIAQGATFIFTLPLCRSHHLSGNN